MVGPTIASVVRIAAVAFVPVLAALDPGFLALAPAADTRVRAEGALAQDQVATPQAACLAPAADTLVQGACPAQVSSLVRVVTPQVSCPVPAFSSLVQVSYLAQGASLVPAF